MLSVAREARPQKTSVRRIVQLSTRLIGRGWNDAEEHRIASLVKEISERLGHQIWEDGYQPGDNPRLLRDTWQYGTQTGVGVAVDVVRSETEHQRYYPILQTLNLTLAKNEALQAKLKRLENHPWWLLWRLMVQPLRWPWKKWVAPKLEPESEED